METLRCDPRYCPVHTFRAFIVGPRQEGCTCERFWWMGTDEDADRRWAERAVSRAKVEQFQVDIGTPILRAVRRLLRRKP